MIENRCNIVWLKRDLRLQNQAALHAAESDGLPYRIIYIFDSNLIHHPDTSLRHLQFVHHAILDLNSRLERFNRRVEIFYGISPEIFEYLAGTTTLNKVFSYQETGIRLSWDRDKAVRKILFSHGIEWVEFPSNGIIRGIKNRQGWDKRWFETMNGSQIHNKYSQNQLVPLNHPFPLPAELEPSLQNYPAQYQPAGETKAWEYLESFTSGRGFNYHAHISKPLESRKSCSRISTYLACGNLSIQQAYQHVKNHPNYNHNKRAFSAFLIRLKWHCHFIQKFEVECEYETLCVNRGYETLKRKNNENYLQAWISGKTGYPLVDACMRAVTTTGWINFRMRAMLVSFLCHHLDQDWRRGVYHLARQFLDYEPGIHYPQFQMQAGTTGINTVRIYNPIKQSYDHDPEGIFIKQWIPELREVDPQYVLEPWKMPNQTQYPHTIIDARESGKQARKKIWGHRRTPEVKREKERILRTHTRAG